MLLELRVENLLLIERAELDLVPGLNVVTGETGAGKTVLAHALDLLLGAKPRSGIVRPGAAEAWVEGVFALDGRTDVLPPEIAERLPEGEDEVVLARRVTAEGRSRAFIGGRSATAADLREVGGALLAFHGQHEARRLLSPAAQLALLDAYCASEEAAPRRKGAKAAAEGHLQRRDAHAAAHAAERDARRRLEELHDAAGARERELDLLRFELQEIDDVAPVEGEQEELSAARERLRHVEALRGAAYVASQALGSDEGSAGAGLATGESALDAVAGVDADLDVLAARLSSLRIEADDLAAELARHLDRLDADPAELERVEERLQALSRLERKHGGSVLAVLDHAERCRQRIAEFEDVEGATEAAEADLADARRRRERLAKELSAARSAAAPRLAAAVVERLAGLAMPAATLEVRLEEREPGPTGADHCELLLAPNPGVPAAPVRESASGGELSRVMLALLAVAGAGTDATQVFDEIDAGVGGQTGRAVGEQLRALGREGQVLCITHLPQIAALADRHFAIEKTTSQETAVTVVRRLDDPEVVGELVRMLGGETGDEGARRHAEELRSAA
ncbi:DNA repair protein RecN [Patulibacter sp.]|uniref:DNA repair protein RecN n=1 Tax=Patulibacter sp. TaxID=1912859 RepID=UPI00271BEC50|nr:DNA repair protein RecN [Patulibacter sp.]MDO9407682.1 DNA repair protein RecN [Patulibacter sp.]